MTVLLVEDEEGIREAFCAFLRMNGHEVVGARCLAQAGDALAGLSPTALITDIDLGDGDGRCLIDEARSMVPGLACLVLTARPTASLGEWIGSRAGVDALEKPIRPTQLLRWLESRTKSKQAVETAGLGLDQLGAMERKLVQRVLGCLESCRPLPTVQAAWREGERLRLRLIEPSLAGFLRGLDSSDRQFLSQLDLDLWPGGAGTTEISFLVDASPTGAILARSEEVAAFVSIPSMRPIEKDHEDGTSDLPDAASQQAPDHCPSVTEDAPVSTAVLSDRVDLERRLLWPSEGGGEGKARSESVMDR